MAPRLLYSLTAFNVLVLLAALWIASLTFSPAGAQSDRDRRTRIPTPITA